MNVIKFLTKVVTVFLIIMFSAFSANAILTINFPEDVEVNRVQFHWDNDSSNATYDGRTITDDPNAVIDFNAGIILRLAK